MIVSTQSYLITNFYGCEFMSFTLYVSVYQKLKAKSAASGEVDVEKLKQYMATQPPPPPPKVEKQKVDLPEHMKEMFERKTKSKTQEELEEEIGKSRRIKTIIL